MGGQPFEDTHGLVVAEPYLHIAVRQCLPGRGFRDVEVGKLQSVISHVSPGNVLGEGERHACVQGMVVSLVGIDDKGRYGVRETLHAVAPCSHLHFLHLRGAVLQADGLQHLVGHVHRFRLVVVVGMDKAGVGSVDACYIGGGIYTESVAVAGGKVFLQGYLLNPYGVGLLPTAAGGVRCADEEDGRSVISGQLYVELPILGHLFHDTGILAVDGDQFDVRQEFLAGLLLLLRHVGLLLRTGCVGGVYAVLAPL